MQLRAQAGFVLVVIFAAPFIRGQNTPVPLQSHQQIHRDTSGVKPSAAVPQQAVPPAPESPQVATSLLDQPAKPAQVQLDAGELSVKADNSTLTDILHNISAKTGMKVDGAPRDQRVFGSYGPAAPREVLSALLDGVNCNVMMVGALDNGAPRELILTPRSAGGVSSDHQTPTVQQNNNNDNNGDDEDDSNQGTPDFQPPRPEPVPPEANQPTEQPVPPANNGQPQVKTPQQMLQELQQMRQQMQQQQQVNPQ
jgi:hypothetical protein